MVRWFGYPVTIHVSVS